MVEENSGTFYFVRRSFRSYFIFHQILDAILNPAVKGTVAFLVVGDSLW